MGSLFRLVSRVWIGGSGLVGLGGGTPGLAVVGVNLPTARHGHYAVRLAG